MSDVLQKGTDNNINVFGRLDLHWLETQTYTHTLTETRLPSPAAVVDWPQQPQTAVVSL